MVFPAAPSFPNPTAKYYHDFKQTASEYARRGKDNDFPKPEVCLFCRVAGCCLVGWGFYGRWAIDASGKHRIPIHVLKCKRQGCGGYISIQPTFLLPYRQYTFAVIYRILCLRLLMGQTLRESWQQVMGTFPGYLPFAYQLVQSWVKALRVRCDFWSGLLQGEIGLAPVVAEVSGTVRMLTILEQYLGRGTTEDVRLARHGDLLNRYRGSPLCRRAYS